MLVVSALSAAYLSINQSIIYVLRLNFKSKFYMYIFVLLWCTMPSKISFKISYLHEKYKSINSLVSDIRILVIRFYLLPKCQILKITGMFIFLNSSAKKKDINNGALYKISTYVTLACSQLIFKKNNSFLFYLNQSWILLCSFSSFWRSIFCYSTCTGVAFLREFTKKRREVLKIHK